MAKFRFQDLKIWQLAIEIADELFDIADEIEIKLESSKLDRLGLVPYAPCPMRYALCPLPSVPCTLL